MAAQRPRLVIDGLAEMRAAFARLPQVTQDAMADAVLQTASAIVRQAQSSLVPGHGFRTGALRRSLGFAVDSRGEGRVGIRRGFDTITPGRSGSALTANGARAHRPTKIGHLIEFGHGGPHRAPAYPFLKPAVQAEEAAFLARCRAAGQVIEQKMGNPNVGSRNL
jgi:hypothetical protein